MLLQSLVYLSSLLALANSVPVQHNAGGHLSSPPHTSNVTASSCFPGLGFTMPSAVPSSLDGWWCDPTTEYAFVGFSYEITACQSSAQLNKEFADIRNTFHGRYVRLYGFCDQPGYYDKVVDAAWNSGLGVHALIWFGFDGSSQWKTRRDALFSSLHNNPKAKFVTRALQFGSEPLFDSVLSVSALAAQVVAAKAALADLQIPVTISEMAFGYQKNGGAPALMSVLDFIDAHMLPFFSGQASTSSKAWPIVLNDLNFFINNGLGKKIWLTENGWPSVTSPGVQPNSPNAVANVANEQGYYQLLDAHCPDFKAVKGGVSWFWHIYSDSQEPGYGLYNTNGKLKFNFAPRTEC